MASELCRAIAYEAAHRGARVNVHELWAALEAVDDVDPKLIVDIGSDTGVLWAWWSLGARVIATRPAAEPGPISAGGLPGAMVTVLIGDPREASTALRVADQVARRPVDVLVLGARGTEDETRAAFHACAPMVRSGGLVLIHGIADPMSSGVRRFWHALSADGTREMVGGADPIGYGIVTIHGRDRANHG